MIKRLFLHCSLFLAILSKAQCPQVYNGLGALSSNPYWISCAGTTTYVMGFQSNQSWGSYTLSWGDGAPNQTGASYVANTVINHTYTSAQPDTFVVTLQIPSQSCTLTGVVVLESSVSPSITLPPGGSNQGCVNAAMQFSNASTGISPTTHFLWNFADGSSPVAFTYTNGQTVSHTYSAVNCATAITMQAWNYCTSTVVTTYSPVQIFGKDTPSITADQLIRCWPNNVFTFTNNSTQNCPGQNTFQRQELWDFGQYWGNITDSIYNWSSWPPTTPHSIAYPAPGTYSIQLRDSNACGISTVAINITLFNTPTANVVAPPAPLCMNTPLTFTNASSPGVFYSWNFGDGGGFNNLGAGNKVHTYTVAGTYTVQLAAFLPGGGSSCSNTAAVVVNILPQPATGFTFSPGGGCTSLSNVTFTDMSVGANTWSWDFGNGNTSILQAPPAQNYTSTGVYNISLSVTALNGCTNVATSTLGVFPTPTANFSPLVGCANSAINFTNTSVITGTNPITSYTWNFADGSPLDMTQNPVHSFTAGVYNVSLTVGSAFCTASITQAFTVNPRPTAGFVSSPTVGCSSFSVSFTNTSTGQTSNLWNFGVIPTSTTNAVSTAFTYSNGTQSVLNYTAALYVSNAFGCVDSSKQVITVLPVPAVSFTGSPTSGCAPVTVNFTNNTVGASTYSWSFGDGNGSVAVNPSNTYTAGGVISQVYTVQLVATNSLGCSSTGSLGINVFPKPSFTFSMNPSAGCSDLSVNFFTVAGATSYTWDFGDASPLSNVPNPTHVFTNTTGVNVNYTVTMIATNAFGCADTSSDFVTVVPKPVADFSATPLAGCSPLNINFTNTSINNTSNSWNFGNGQTANTLNGSATYTNSPGSSSSTFSVHLVVYNASTCVDSITKVITLYDRPMAGFTADTPACSPKVITFTNTSTGNNNTYSWNFGNGSTSTQTNASQTYTAGGASGPQSYTVLLVATSTNNCRDSYTANIVVHPQPVFNIVSSPDSGCAILRVNFANISGVQQYQWNFGDGSTGSGGGTFHGFLNTGTTSTTYTVQLIAKDIFGCADTSTKVVKVYAGPQASFAASPLSLTGAQAVSFTNQSVGAVNYNWLFGDGSSSTQFEPMYVYQQAGEYVVKLVAYSNKGCRDTFQLADKIIVQDENIIQIPNAFTPNQAGSPGNVYDPLDKSNDVFHVNMKNVESFKMSIFSRWGELLYETNNHKEGWDGYYKGKLCQQDVYVWKIQAGFTDGSKFDKTGDLQLIR